MFDFDSFREIWGTIRKNKMRTFLTGFAVAWGIFMLIILLASGNGLRNGVMSNFAGRAVNSVMLYPGWTSMPYGGMSSNRRIRFDDQDYELIAHRLPEVEYFSVGINKEVTLSYGDEYGTWQVQGVSSDYARIGQLRIPSAQGRFLNRLDVDLRKKVIVLSPEAARVLFKEEDPLGKYVLQGNIAYRVVGVYDGTNQFWNTASYIPWTTAQSLYKGGYGFDRIDFTLQGIHTLEENRAFIQRLRNKLGQLHRFHPDDRSALWVNNTAESSIEAQRIFALIRLFVILVGIASLMAGIVGVGNIMLITVKERTREIGIRKAIGASPRSILLLIILEAILITTAAGYIGIVLGVGLTEGVSAWMSHQTTENLVTIFKDPTVDLGIVVGATILLIVSGIVAGLVPALKAARVRPIEAMRAE